MSEESVRAGLSWFPENISDPRPTGGGWIYQHQEVELEKRIGSELNNWLERRVKVEELEKARKHIQRAREHLNDARWGLADAIKLAGGSPEFRDLAQPIFQMKRQLDDLEQAHVDMFAQNAAELHRIISGQRRAA